MSKTVYVTTNTSHLQLERLVEGTPLNLNELLIVDRCFFLVVLDASEISAAIKVASRMNVKRSGRIVGPIQQAYKADEFVAALRQQMAIDEFDRRQRRLRPMSTAGQVHASQATTRAN